MRKEAAVAWFNVLSRHLPGPTEENFKRVAAGSQYLSSGLSKYVAALHTR
jgi:hypothetical protein